MSFATQVQAGFTRVGQEIKALRTSVWTKTEADSRYRQSTYNVLASSTVDTMAGQWTKIATLQVTARYQDATVVLNFLSFGSANNNTSKATVMARLKQQDVMGNLPLLYVGVEDNAIIIPSDIRLVTTTTTAGQTLAELWFRDSQPYDIMTVTESYFAHGGGTVTYHQQQPFQATAPTGLQFIAGVNFPIDYTVIAGLGSAATRNVGTTAGTVAAGDDPRFSAGGGASLPAGMMAPWGGAANAIPSGWLACDGAAVSRTTYSALFAAIGTLHGVGDNSTTFNLPDTQDRLLRGSGTTSAGTTDGRAAGTARTSSFVHSHSHTASAGTSISSDSAGTPAGSISSVSGGTPAGSISSVDISHTHSMATHTHSISDGTVSAITASNTTTGGTAVRATGLSGGVHAHGGATGSGGATATGSGGSTSHSHTFTGSALAGHSHTFTGSALGTHSHSASTGVTVNSGLSPDHSFIAIPMMIKT